MVTSWCPAWAQIFQLPASDSKELGLQVCAVLPDHVIFLSPLLITVSTVEKQFIVDFYLFFIKNFLFIVYMCEDTLLEVRIEQFVDLWIDVLLEAPPQPPFSLSKPCPSENQPDCTYRVT